MRPCRLSDNDKSPDAYILVGSRQVQRTDVSFPGNSRRPWGVRFAPFSERIMQRRRNLRTMQLCVGLRLFTAGNWFLSMPDPELHVFHTSLGIDHDGGWPAPHAISSGDALLRILHEGE